MTRKLIINADGFGFTPGVNRGIVDAIEHGVVSSVSCVVNFPWIREARHLSRLYPHISIGIHFNLSVGRPVSPVGEVPTLVDPKGEFWGIQLPQRLLTGQISMRDIESELTAQVRVLLDMGIHPSHWDGHQNKHLLLPFFVGAMRVAKRAGIQRMRTHRRYLIHGGEGRTRSLVSYYVRHPQRVATHLAGRVLSRVARHYGFRMADRLITPGYVDGGSKALLSTWLQVVALLPQGVNEIYCHPGYPDEVLREYALYVEPRAKEVEVLTSKELRHAIEAHAVEVVSFYDL